MRIFSAARVLAARRGLVTGHADFALLLPCSGKHGDTLGALGSSASKRRVVRGLVTTTDVSLSLFPEPERLGPWPHTML